MLSSFSLLTRRALFAAPLAAVPGADLWSGAFRVDPGIAPVPFRTQSDNGRLRIEIAGSAAPIFLPGARARILVKLPLAGREVLVATFAGDGAASRGPLDLLAVIGSDGARRGVLAVEMLRWQGEGGAGFDTRLDAPGAGTLLRLARVASPPQASTASRHFIWADYLAWRQGGALADAAPRPPRPGTWQAALAAIRARIAPLLTPPPHEVTLALLAPTGLLDPTAEIPPQTPPISR
jgi:hypothetical protein